MTKCIDCNREQITAESCDQNRFGYIIRDGKIFKRDTTWFDALERCHDCGIVNKEGNLHHYGCDIERCPCCKQQLISCSCDTYDDIESEDFVGNKEECIVALKKMGIGSAAIIDEGAPVKPKVVISPSRKATTKKNK